MFCLLLLSILVLLLLFFSAVILCTCVVLNFFQAIVAASNNDGIFYVRDIGEYGMYIDIPYIDFSPLYSIGGTEVDLFVCLFQLSRLLCFILFMFHCAA